MQQWRLVQVHAGRVGPEHTTGPVSHILAPPQFNRRLTHLDGV